MDHTLHAGSFDHGKQVGLWKRYYENGQLWDEGVYEDGKKVGELIGDFDAPPTCQGLQKHEQVASTFPSILEIIWLV